MAAPACDTHPTSETSAFPYPAWVNSKQATAKETAEENKASVQAPSDIGERHLKTRSMFKNLDGRPRSAISSGGEASAPASPTHKAARMRSGLFSSRWARKAIAADAPAMPPMKK